MVATTALNTGLDSLLLFSCPAADNPVENPVKAKLQSDDRTQVVSVVVRQASNIKPTLFQVCEVSGV